MNRRTLILLSMYDKLDTESKRALVQHLICESEEDDIKKKIDNQTQELSTLIMKENRFVRDFASNLLGNAVFDGTVFLLSKLLKLH